MKIFNIFLVACIFSFAVACGSKKNEEKQEEAKQETKESQEEKKESASSKPDMNVAEVKMLVKKWALKSIVHKDGKKEENIDNAFLELKEDGTFVEFFAGKEVATGNWELSADKKTFTLIHKTGPEATTLKDGREKSAIKELTDNKFVTEDENIETYEPAK
ncbi:MAG: hypothetical protein NZ551_08105 [Microscillaceae bacterium]|nr:hypothetical protein [Microscillaceae bacterium]MDW8461160.1 hypothetical protein [Cytophagales bacterium]